MSNQKSMLMIASALVLIVVAIFYFMPGYGKTSQVGYELAQALYSACNMKDAGRIEKVKSMLDQQMDDNEIKQNEYRWLNSIIQLAEQNKWKDAVRESRKLLAKQVSIAPASSNSPSHSH